MKSFTIVNGQKFYSEEDPLDPLDNEARERRKYEAYLKDVKRNPDLIEKVPLQYRYGEMLDIIIEVDGTNLYYVPRHAVTSKLCEKAVKKNGYALRYVPTFPVNMRTPRICEIAVENAGEALEWVPEELRTAELCEKAVENNPHAFGFVPDTLQTLYLCKLVVSKYGGYLEKVLEKFKIDEVCELAVKSNGRSLQYVPEEKKTYEICKFAIENYPDAIRDLPGNFSKEQYVSLYKIAVEELGCSIQLVPDEFKTFELCEIAVTQDGRNLHFIKDELQSLELVEIALEESGINLVYVAKRLITPAVCKLAVENDFPEKDVESVALEFVPPEMRTFEICKISVINNPKSFPHVPPQFKDELRELALKKAQDAPVNKQYLKKKDLQKGLKLEKNPTTIQIFDFYALNFARAVVSRLNAPEEKEYVERLYRDKSQALKQYYLENLYRELIDEVKTTKIPQLLSERNVSSALIGKWYLEMVYSRTLLEYLNYSQGEFEKMKKDGKVYVYNPKYVDQSPSYQDFIYLFLDIPWRPKFGGYLWAKIAYVSQQLSKASEADEILHWIDVINNLAHNTASILNKFDDIKKCYRLILDAKASTDSIEIMYPHCSKEVRELLKAIRFQWRRGLLLKKLRVTIGRLKIKRKAVKEYFDEQEIRELLSVGLPDLKIEKMPGEKRDFAGIEEETLPFAYGEIPNYINPADDMGWDVIVVPSAVGLSKEQLVPIGVLRYNRDENFWKSYPNEKPIGNDKILLGKRGKDSVGRLRGEYTKKDLDILVEYVKDKPIFEKDMGLIWDYV